jgi:protein translocase SecG subunit
MFEAIFRAETLWWILMVIYLPACILLITVVLLQKGKGVGFAGAFGMGGGSETVFGPRASKSLPVRLTHFAAALFLILALMMSVVSAHVGKGPAPEKVAETEERPFSSLDELGLGEAPAEEQPTAAEEGASAIDQIPVTVEEEAPTSEEPGLAPVPGESAPVADAAAGSESGSGDVGTGPAETAAGAGEDEAEQAGEEPAEAGQEPS